MLNILKIRNLAVIEFAEVEFKKGLNVISGETGAGKSIILDAISLILGSRASVDLIRNECEEATVEALFDVAEMPWLHDRLKRLGFQFDRTQLLIKRVINRNSKGRIYINGELSTLQLLQSVCEDLVDLCSQNEHQALLQPIKQLDILDRFGEVDPFLESYRQCFSHYRGLKKELDFIKHHASEVEKKRDYLEFQYQELKNSNIQNIDEVALINEKNLFQSAEQRYTAFSQICAWIDGPEVGAIPFVKLAHSKLKQIGSLDDKTQLLCAELQQIIFQLEDFSLSINRYLENIPCQPSRLNEIQETLHVLQNLKRKYGSTLDEIKKTYANIDIELSNLSNSSEKIIEITKQLNIILHELNQKAELLDKMRNRVIESFCKSVSSELSDLKMQGAKFKIEVEKLSFENWNDQGSSKIQFLIQSNIGETFKPLAKIASGGELSRIMLAIRRVLAEPANCKDFRNPDTFKGMINVFLFDEIDAGIGGTTAIEVGKKLKIVSKNNQVICITHLAQVASFADFHLRVEKQIYKGRTITQVVPLETKEVRVEELARMMGGTSQQLSFKKSAQELMKHSNF